MQVIFIKLFNPLSWLGTSYEKIFEWKFRLRKTLPWN